jgi:hypothetical protein
MGQPGMKLDTNHIRPDHPLRLETAVRLAFPDGSMTVSGLRRERDAGRLEVERIAGKDYVTLHAIEEMRRLCRVRRKAPASGYAPSAGTKQVSSSQTPLGSSSMEDDTTAQDALRAKLLARSKSYKST